MKLKLSLIFTLTMIVSCTGHDGRSSSPAAADSKTDRLTSRRCKILFRTFITGMPQPPPAAVQSDRLILRFMIALPLSILLWLAS